MFLIEEKEEIARNRIIKEFEGSDIQVLNGRFGPYISDGKLNGRIPKDREPASLSLEEVQTLLQETGKPMRGRGRFAKKAVTKKQAAPKKTATATPAAKKAAKTSTKKTGKKVAKKKVAKKAAKKVVKKAASKATADAANDDAPF